MRLLKPSLVCTKPRLRQHNGVSKARQNSSSSNPQGKINANGFFMPIPLTNSVLTFMALV